MGKNKRNVPVFWRIKKWVESENGRLKIPLKRMIETLGCSKMAIYKAKKRLEKVGWHWHYNRVEGVIEIHMSNISCSEEYLEYQSTLSKPSVNPQSTLSKPSVNPQSTPYIADNTNVLSEAFSKENEACTNVHEALTNVSEADTHVSEACSKEHETFSNEKETIACAIETEKSKQSATKIIVFDKSREEETGEEVWEKPLVGNTVLPRAPDTPKEKIYDEQLSLRPFGLKYAEPVYDAEKQKKLEEIQELIDMIYQAEIGRKSFVRRDTLWRIAELCDWDRETITKAVIGYLRSKFAKKHSYCPSKLQSPHVIGRALTDAEIFMHKREVVEEHKIYWCIASMWDRALAMIEPNNLSEKYWAAVQWYLAKTVDGAFIAKSVFEKYRENYDAFLKYLYANGPPDVELLFEPVKERIGNADKAKELMGVVMSVLKQPGMRERIRKTPLIGKTIKRKINF